MSRTRCKFWFVGLWLCFSWRFDFFIFSKRSASFIQVLPAPTRLVLHACISMRHVCTHAHIFSRIDSNSCMCVDLLIPACLDHADMSLAHDFHDSYCLVNQCVLIYPSQADCIVVHESLFADHTYIYMLSFGKLVFFSGSSNSFPKGIKLQSENTLFPRIKDISVPVW